VDNEAKVWLCAHNNADWYEAIFKSHSLCYERSAACFTSLAPAPPYYSQLTTLQKDETTLQLRQIERIASSIGKSWSLKDSFNTLNLDQCEFKLLFSAEWIWREAREADLPEHWRCIIGADELQQWEDAWKRHGSPTEGTVFLPSLLSDPDVTVLARTTADSIVGGAVINQSQHCLGLSNIFNVSFEDAAAAAQSFSPGFPLVGYETGEALKEAHGADFSSVGGLRVWTT
jgi:hypothetical protein